MATSSFISRWSKRKLEEASSEDHDLNDDLNTNTHSDLAVTQPEATCLNPDAGSVEEANATDPAPEESKPEEMSIANLLVSEASESVKKAALRKLFLSEEFNVRDGLDDYDDNYSNLKSMSEGIAETLRDWVKEKADEAPSIDEIHSTVAETEPAIVDIDESEQEHAENTQNNEELYIKTVSDKNGTLEKKSTSEQLSASEQLGQNIPQQK
ncbi:DUF3306 domain-containing protein [Vibrio sp. YIC-376]|uniref:DUF3306 domain-containing protein n=1 Tax=Vibrio sp. YIC-376 TaxID=3136162 RepID=UPI00402A8D9D